MSKNIELIKSLIEQIKTLNYGVSDELDAFQRRAKMIVGIVFGESHNYVSEMSNMAFTPRMLTSRSFTTDELIRSWQRGIRNSTNLLNTMIEELELRAKFENKPVGLQSQPRETFSNRIFVVHGRNEEMKQTVSRTIEKLGLEPVILHEQANKGNTVIEKFEEYSDVGFAVVLLSGDDKGYLKAQTSKSSKTRARQNVIFEMGFFIGKLGRKQVLLLLETDVERPSDIDGLVYTAYDGTDGRWRLELVRELKICGYDVSADKLL